MADDRMRNSDRDDEFDETGGRGQKSPGRSQQGGKSHDEHGGSKLGGPERGEQEGDQKGSYGQRGNREAGNNREDMKH